MSKKILLVEDDKDIINLVKHYLEKEGYRTFEAADGVKGLDILKREKIDLAILDIMLPELNGIDVLKRIKGDVKTANIPVIMLTAKGEETDKIVGLELGADDYITKPFSPKELVARIKALLRRMEKPVEKTDTLKYGELIMDISRHEVKVKGKEIELTAKEFGLLEELLRNKGRVLTRDTLLNNVWGYDYFGNTRTVDVHVRRLREKMPLLEKSIITVKQLGYKLSEEMR
ncbi:MAG: response regulator transcription factor [Nitrospirae bacterium]|nr:response regulator transcription factor [Nitrospirota bacterium]